MGLEEQDSEEEEGRTVQMKVDLKLFFFFLKEEASSFDENEVVKSKFLGKSLTQKLSRDCILSQCKNAGCGFERTSCLISVNFNSLISKMEVILVHTSWSHQEIE